MADPKPVPKLVPVLDPNRKFAFVPEDQIGNLPEGARVLTKKEIQQRALDDAYAKQSTAQKVVGAAAGPTATQLANPTATAIAGHAPDVAIATHPAVEAFSQGALEPLTLGTERLAIKKATESLAGKQAAANYVQHGQDVEDVYSGSHTAGQLAGLATSAAMGGAGLGKLVPGVGVSALGGAAESIAARGAAKVVGQGVLGRAATSAVGLGARGAVEGGIYAGAHETVAEQLQDHELAADKIFAAAGTGALYGGVGGAALGGAGSLAKSAASNAGRGVMGLAGKLAPRAETAAVKAEGAAADAEGLAESSLTTSRQKNFFNDVRSVEGQKGLAYDEAWKAIGGGGTLAPTRPVKIASRSLPNGTRDLGEIALRHKIIDAEGGVWNAFANGKAASMVERGLAAESAVGSKIGALTDASGASVAGHEIQAEIDKIAKPFERLAGQEHIGASIRDYGDLLKGQLGVTSTEGTASVQRVLEQRKALGQLAYNESKQLDPKMRVQALRDLNGGIEELITKKIDAAAEGLPAGTKRAEYQLLKKDFHGLKLINEVLEDTAARQAKASTLGLTSIAAGAAAVASGNFVAAPIAAIGTKLLKDRGNAALAVALYNAAERGTLTNMVTQIDSLIGRASKGLLAPPVKGPLPVAMTERPLAAAQAAMSRTAAYQADPDKLANDIALHTEAMAGHSPEIASAVTQRFVSAVSFMAAKMPVSADPDPLDPHPAPRLSDAQAREYALYDWYTQDPKRFFVEVAHGKLTPEGAEVAQALMPDAFAQLQMLTAEALSTQMARGHALPFQQRLALGALLNFAAVPSQRPDHAAMLQGMLASAQQPPDAPAPKPRSSTKIATQQSALDRLEAGSPGKRS